MSSAWHGAAVLLLALGCAREAPPPASQAVDSASAAEFPALPDSLALAAPGGVQVWFTGARVGTGADGATCLERGLVIERAGVRNVVPLLMTGAAPELVNDSTIRARLWRDCRPGDTYDVNLRTAHPTRVP